MTLNLINIFQITEKLEILCFLSQFFLSNWETPKKNPTVNTQSHSNVTKKRYQIGIFQK